MFTSLASVNTSAKISFFGAIKIIPNRFTFCNIHNVLLYLYYKNNTTMAKENKSAVLNFRLTAKSLSTFKEICELQGETVSNTLNQLVNNFNNKFKTNGKIK